ncbi:MAG: MGMT family protein [Firmicutes bacterium]|nr:MGMT family protein [Bacillota bacterium]
MNTFEKIYEVVKSIPKGKVATYGQVAILAGNPHWARVVGYALHNNPDPSSIPCHRVVNREGKVAEVYAFGGGIVQRQLLEGEGIAFLPDGRIDLEKHSIQI